MKDATELSILTKEQGTFSPNALKQHLKNDQVKSLIGYVATCKEGLACGSGQYLFFMGGEELCCLPIVTGAMSPSIVFVSHTVSNNIIVSENVRFDSKVKNTLPKQVLESELVSEINDTLNAEQQARTQAATQYVDITLPLEGCTLSSMQQQVLYASGALLERTPSFKAYLQTLLENPDFSDDKEKKIAALKTLIVNSEEQDTLLKKYTDAADGMKNDIATCMVCFFDGHGIAHFDATSLICAAEGQDNEDQTNQENQKKHEVPTIGQIFTFYQGCVQQIIKKVDPQSSVPLEQCRQMSADMASMKLGDESPALKAQRQQDLEQAERTNCLTTIVFNIVGVAFNTPESVPKFQTYKADVIQAIYDLLKVAEEHEQTPQLLENMIAYDNVRGMIAGDNSAEDASSESIWGHERVYEALEKTARSILKLTPITDCIPKPPLIGQALATKLHDFFKVSAQLAESEEVQSHGNYEKVRMAVLLGKADLLTQAHLLKFLGYQKEYDAKKILSLCLLAKLPETTIVEKFKLLASANDSSAVAAACIRLEENGFLPDVILQNLGPLSRAKDPLAVANACICLKRNGFAPDVILQNLKPLSRANDPWDVTTACINLKENGFPPDVILKNLWPLSMAKDPLAVTAACINLKENGFLPDVILKNLKPLPRANDPLAVTTACINLKENGFPPDVILQNLWLLSRANDPSTVAGSAVFEMIGVSSNLNGWPYTGQSLFRACRSIEGALKVPQKNLEKKILDAKKDGNTLFAGQRANILAGVTRQTPVIMPG